MSIASQKAETRAKILMVLNAHGKPIKAADLAEDPLLKGTISAKGVVMNMRTLWKMKEVRRVGKNQWAPLKSRSVATSEKPNMFFTINLRTAQISLNIAGLQLPVMTEE